MPATPGLISASNCEAHHARTFGLLKSGNTELPESGDTGLHAGNTELSEPVNTELPESADSFVQAVSNALFAGEC